MFLKNEFIHIIYFLQNLINVILVGYLLNNLFYNGNDDGFRSSQRFKPNKNPFFFLEICLRFFFEEVFFIKLGIIIVGKLYLRVLCLFIYYKLETFTRKLCKNHTYCDVKNDLWLINIIDYTYYTYITGCRRLLITLCWFSPSPRLHYFNYINYISYRRIISNFNSWKITLETACGLQYKYYITSITLIT